MEYFHSDIWPRPKEKPNHIVSQVFLRKIRSYFGNEKKKIFLIIDITEQVNTKINIVSSVLKYLY